MRKQLFCVVLFLLLISSPTLVRAQDETGWLLAQINSVRASHGLPALSLNSQLTAAARSHSQYLSTHSWSNPHIEADGSTPRSRIAGAGYPNSTVGENVYGGLMANAQIAFNWWLGSPIHLQGIVNPAFNEIGIGIGNGPYGQFYTTDFGGGGSGSGSVSSAAPVAPAQVSAPGTPRPTRRPLPSPIPTNTAGPSLTPSLTFTPEPTRTSTQVPTAEPPTSTAILIEVTAQTPFQAVAQVPSQTPLSNISRPTDSILPTPTLAPIGSSTAPTSSSDLIRALIPVAIGIQVLILGGVLVRRGRQ